MSLRQAAPGSVTRHVLRISQLPGGAGRGEKPLSNDEADNERERIPAREKPTETCRAICECTGMGVKVRTAGRSSQAY